MTIDLSKPLQTKDGRDVEFLTFTGRDKKFPLVGYISDGPELHHWTPDGIHVYAAGGLEGDHPNNLMNIPKVAKVVVRYLNWYGGAFSQHPSLDNAKRAGGEECLARIRVEFKEGQFDTEDTSRVTLDDTILAASTLISTTEMSDFYVLGVCHMIAAAFPKGDLTVRAAQILTLIKEKQNEKR